MNIHKINITNKKKSLESWYIDSRVWSVFMTTNWLYIISNLNITGQTYTHYSHQENDIEDHQNNGCWKNPDWSNIWAAHTIPWHPRLPCHLQLPILMAVAIILKVTLSIVLHITAQWFLTLYVYPPPGLKDMVLLFVSPVYRLIQWLVF